MVCSWGCFCPVGRCLGAGACSCSPEDKVKNPPSPAPAHQTVLSPVLHLMGCHRRLSTARTGTSCSHGGDGISSLMKVNCAE